MSTAIKISCIAITQDSVQALAQRTTGWYPVIRSFCTCDPHQSIAFAGRRMSIRTFDQPNIAEVLPGSATLYETYYGALLEMGREAARDCGDLSFHRPMRDINGKPTVSATQRLIYM